MAVYEEQAELFLALGIEAGVEEPDGHYRVDFQVPAIVEEAGNLLTGCCEEVAGAWTYQDHTAD